MRTRYTATYQAGIIPHTTGLLFAVACIPLLASQVVHAQKGMGDLIGVARKGLQPPRMNVSGKILSIETHRCEKATGRAVAGTHLIVEGTDGAQYNLHIGPADAVASITESLEPGGQIEAIAFRTSKLPENQYVAISLTLGNGTVAKLRDSNLRPFWAGRNRLSMAGNCRCRSYQRGWGFGRHSRWRSAYGSGPWRGSRRRSGRCLY
jgi:hypothetical protein